MEIKKFFRLSVALPILAFSLFACNTTPKTELSEEKPALSASTPQPDLVQVLSEIKAIETEWAKAINDKDIVKMMSMYADDAVSMPDKSAALMGKQAIQKHQEEEFKNAKAGNTISFETVDVFSEGNQVLEIGKSIVKDAAGKVTDTGKYMAFYEKRDGKYLCIREMYNSDK